MKRPRIAAQGATNQKGGVLGTVSSEVFLKKFWQKRPLLVRGAISSAHDIISVEEVAGLSLEEGIESRLILEKGGKTPWELRRGPFPTSLFKKLPRTHWTILVNGVDRFVPGVHALIEKFSFVPYWRMDDIMISIAADKGNVGAHVDNFDVFLIQGAGKRRWMIEDRPVHEDDFVPNLPVRLLRHFKPTHSWVLEPGDMLYLPPRFPHHGVAEGDGCMTISVGCRAPSVAELINGATNAALQGCDESARYTDKDLTLQAPGEISAHSLAMLRERMLSALSGERRFAEWFGSFITEPYDDVSFKSTSLKVTKKQLVSLLREEAQLTRVEGARFAYVALKGKKVLFFVNGEPQELDGVPAKLGRLVSDSFSITAAQLKPFLGDEGAVEMLRGLLNRGVLVVESGERE